MSKGDNVVTAGGIYGRIREIDENTNSMLIEVDKDVKIRVDRNSVYPPQSKLTRQYNRRNKSKPWVPCKTRPDAP